MRSRSLFVAAALLCVPLLGCGGTKTEAPLPVSRIIRQDGMQIAFEVMSMAQHEQMMQAMNLPMDHDPQAKDVVSLTIVEQHDHRLIRDAQVRFVIYRPDNSKVEHKGMTMPGTSMFHYVADFRRAGKGIYKVEAFIDRRGHTTHVMVEFEL